MIPRWLLLVVSLWLAWSAQPAAAKNNAPTVKATEVDSLPLNLFYFEGTETVIFTDGSARSASISFDGGQKWEPIKGDGMEGAVTVVFPHPFNADRAYALGTGGQHWITTDQGKTWQSFKLEKPFGRRPLGFNGWDPSKVIFTSQECSFLGCLAPEFYYTTDDFKTVKPLREHGLSWECHWAASTPEFMQDTESQGTLGNRVLCVIPGLRDKSARLVYSDQFFQDSKDGTEVNLDPGRPVTGKDINVLFVKKYIVAALLSRGTMEQALYVSDDSKEWHRAEFGGGRLEESAYTLLESTTHSLQVDVQTSRRQNLQGVLYSSNSNGTYFTPNIRHTNRDMSGRVDFERIADIQGILMVNTVKNWKDLGASNTVKKLVNSSISFDDGRTFHPLKADGNQIHIHSMTTYNALNEIPDPGRMFSSHAPGLVMGVGNTGDHLKKYSEGDLYVSDDAGLTWRIALKGPHRFEFGDQGGLIVAVSSNETTGQVQFSLDYGKAWETLKLDHTVKPIYITTTPDATSLKFLLLGISTTDKKFVLYSFNFESLSERKCSESDLEPWQARVGKAGSDTDGSEECIMGQKQIFQRRKANADCLIKKKIEAKYEPCKCSAQDFECDYNFKRTDDGKCVPAVPLTPPAGKCKNPSDTFKGPSGLRLIPGNACVREGGKNLDQEIDHSCGNTGNSTTSPIADGQVRAGKAYFFPATDGKYFYLERQASNSGDDETIFMLSSKNELYVTHDHGKTWTQPSALKGEKIVEIIQHPHYTDGAYFLTNGKTVFSTINRGYKFNKFTKPTSFTPKDLSPLSFHEKHMDWMLWIGSDDCDGADCLFNAYWSKNRGDEWHLMLRGVSQCMFGYHEGRTAFGERRDMFDELVLCEQYQQESKKSNRQLVSSKSLTDWSNSELEHDNIAHFVTINDYIVVATYLTENHKFLNVSTSLNGTTFAEGHFPFNVDVSQYTALPGSTYALFLFVATNSKAGRSYGSLVKSNSNGTYFIQSLEAVNENDDGYVDFEKMGGLDGVAIANVVANREEVESKGVAKKLHSKITHNDGGQWAFLAPPIKSLDGKGFGCSATNGQGTEKCALHLHGYTERTDWRDTFYSGSAIGMMIGHGNVGEYLTPAEEADTFLSSDGGITWKHTKQGRYMFEYGDAGSVVVLVSEMKPTNVLYYSLDEGNTWIEYQFSDTELIVTDITTVPSDTSKNFLLWVKETKAIKASDSKFGTVNIDFSGIWNRQCDLDEGERAGKDSYLWTPTHPFQKDQQNCLFGHVEQYHRKNPGAECWIDWHEPLIHQVGANCSCTRTDYEWYAHTIKSYAASVRFER